MDWNAAIEHHREALTRILAMLVTMAGFADDPADTADRPTLPRHLHRAVLRLLRPAEAAARRLVIVVARGLVVTPQARKRETPTPPPPRFAWSPAGASHLSRPSFGPPVNGGGSVAAAVRNLGSSPAKRGRGTAESGGGGVPEQDAKFPPAPALPLFDPLPRWRGPRRPVGSGVPRISVPGIAAPFPIPAPPSPHDPLDATRLALRLTALARTLDDLPVAARRFALWQARIATRNRTQENDKAASAEAKNPRRVRRLWPFRPGRPPGQRAPRSREPSHPVHAVLDDVHGLALWALEPADTS